MLRVKNRIPYRAAIGRFPDATSRRSNVIDRGIAGYTCDGRDASGTIGAYFAPAHCVIGVRIDLLR